MPPLVTVGIPLYNSERFIAAAIDSVLQQSFDDFELVVIDDASTDSSCSIVNGYKDPRLRLIRHEQNLGAEVTWNHVLEEARGKYLKILCHDDLLYPNCLSAQVLSLEASDKVVMACCGRDIINSQGAKILTRRFPGEAGIYAGPAVVRRSVWWGTNIIGEPTAVLMRVAAARKIGLFRACWPYVIDLDYWCRLLREGQLYVERIPLCAFRVSDQSWSVALVRKQSRQFRQLALDLCQQGKVSWLAYAFGSGLSLVYAALRRFFY